MRIVCISDTHSRHDQVEVPPGDVLVHAGDSTMAGRVEEITKFNHWLVGLPHPYKILARSPSWWRCCTRWSGGPSGWTIR